MHRENAMVVTVLPGSCSGLGTAQNRRFFRGKQARDATMGVAGFDQLTVLRAGLVFLEQRMRKRADLTKREREDGEDRSSSQLVHAPHTFTHRE